MSVSILVSLDSILKLKIRIAIIKGARIPKVFKRL
jgi:hypothetical protein